MADLVITAKEVKSTCSAGIQTGDKIVLRGATLSLTESDRICGFAFANIYPAVFAVRLGKDLRELGLVTRTVQCIDPGPPYSEGGTVLFEIKAL
ncbi:TIGR04076 family protein [Sporomusa aerivorans]|uniref:TIGR04076 family protein n=1 Tax=Sporomusa aerivorans TaxID=204936 RepID=UPI00352BA520